MNIESQVILIIFNYLVDDFELVIQYVVNGLNIYFVDPCN